MTLYYRTSDSPGMSNASGTVLNNWPIFYISNFVVPPPLKASDFAVITRPDFMMQTTYKGWPLYYYIGDKAPGDTNGQGLGGVWFVVTPSNFTPPVTSGTSGTTSGSTSSSGSGGSSSGY
jgi:predicted lipoprotein with Yx(FWY)xxD motif